MIQSTMITPTVLQPQAPTQTAVKAEATPAESIRQFGSFLEDALQSVASKEENYKVTTDKFMQGEATVDQLMISAQQALLSVQLTTQVRNKVVEAYQEIMRTQI